MKLLLHHLAFRWNQFFRMSRLQPGQALGNFLLLGLLIFIEFEANSTYAWVFCLPCFLLQWQRKDTAFLQKIFGQHWSWVMAIENLCIYTAMLLLNYNCRISAWAGWGMLLVIGLPFCWPKPKARGPSKVISLFDGVHFELNAAFRASPVGFGLCLLLFYASCYHISLQLMYGSVFISAFAYIYQHHENKEMLARYFSSKSLASKIMDQLKIINGLLLPGFLVGFFGMGNPWVLLILLAASHIYVALKITTKYANYHHLQARRPVDMVQELIDQLAAMTLVLGLYLLKKRYQKAQKNIENYVRN